MTAERDQLDDFTQRAWRRLPVGEGATLRDEQSYSVTVTVQDMSQTGFMADCPRPVRIGAYVLLEVPGLGPVRAQVRWQLGGRMGGMFIDPISLAKCEWTAVRSEAATA